MAATKKAAAKAPAKKAAATKKAAAPAKAAAAAPTRRSDGRIRYPHVTVTLSDTEGEAYQILGRVQRALRDAGAPVEDQRAFYAEATAKDYDHLLRTTVRWVKVF